MKNYTSTVAATKSIEQIEQMLIRFRAQNITKSYDENFKVKSLLFTIKVPESPIPIAIQLPAKVDSVLEVLLKARKTWVSVNQRKAITEQAERTAWRLMYDWLAVQLSLIELRQVEAAQVFLPFVWNGQQSFYERLRDAKFVPLLTAPSPPPAETPAETDDDSND